MTDAWAKVDGESLTLIGRESMHSLYQQSLVATRLTELDTKAQVRLSFAPEAFWQSAGLAAWYDTNGYYYLRVTHHEEYGQVLGVVTCDDGVYEEKQGYLIPIDGWPDLYLRAEFSTDTVQFFASQDGTNWQAVGRALDLTKLSDDYGSTLRFTGCFVALCCQDLNQTGVKATFEVFQWVK